MKKRRPLKKKTVKKLKSKNSVSRGGAKSPGKSNLKLSLSRTAQKTAIRGAVRRNRLKGRSGGGVFRAGNVPVQVLGLGLIFFSAILGIALAFSAQGPEHVLGVYFGQKLSGSFQWIFGRFPSWIVVLGFLGIGWNLAKKINPLTSFNRNLLIIFLLIEFCVLLSLRVLSMPSPGLGDEAAFYQTYFRDMGGVLGVLTTVKLIYPVFGDHVWGARFIFGALIFFTLIVGLGIRIDELLNRVNIYFKLAVNAIARTGYSIYSTAVVLIERNKAGTEETRTAAETRKLVIEKLELEREKDTKKLKRLKTKTRMMEKYEEGADEAEILKQINRKDLLADRQKAFFIEKENSSPKISNISVSDVGADADEEENFPFVEDPHKHQKAAKVKGVQKREDEEGQQEAAQKEERRQEAFAKQAAFKKAKNKSKSAAENWPDGASGSSSNENPIEEDAGGAGNGAETAMENSAEKNPDPMMDGPKESITQKILGLVRNKKREAPEDAAEETFEGGEGEGSPQGDVNTFEVESAASQKELDPEALTGMDEAAPEIQYDEYVKPTLDILPDPPTTSVSISQDRLLEKAKILETKLQDFGIEGKIDAINPGPVITQFEVALAPGIRVSKVENLSNDLAMAMRAKRIRIVAPIPGKATVGIEVPNEDMQTVYFKDVCRTLDFTNQSDEQIKLVLGKNIIGKNTLMDIAKMPHLLIGGQTGSGKSVGINSLLISVLLTKTPEQVRLLLVDPKVVELSEYNGIPHLITPVVNDPREAVRALKWACVEMDKRYKILAKAGVRNISSFNKKFKEGALADTDLEKEDIKRMAYILIVIDELADLMMTAPKEVETHIARIAQLARAIGIHLVLATQSPRTTVITGAIKANLPSRIAFSVAQGNDSRTILDRMGAQNLLGSGDMLFLPSGSPEVFRVHGSFISDDDIGRVLKFIKDQKVKKEYIDNFAFMDESLHEEAAGAKSAGTSASGARGDGNLLREAAYLVVAHKMGSTSLLQRRLKVGYARAGRLMDELEDMGIVAPNNGSKAREVYVESQEMVDTMFEASE